MHTSYSSLLSIFLRANLSLACCSSAEPASVSVQLQKSVQQTIFTNCRKSQPYSRGPQAKTKMLILTFYQ